MMQAPDNRRRSTMMRSLDKLRVLVLGSESAFSAIVIEQLEAAGVAVCGFVTAKPGTRRASAGRFAEIPVVMEGSGSAAAVHAGLPIIRLDPVDDAETLSRAADLAPDIVLAACFPVILDEDWLRLPRELALNLHPSLLPSYRGPVPLFWQLREGEHETGITLHVMAHGVDAGDIVAQSTLALPAGQRFSQINATLAAMGAGLVVDFSHHIAAGLPVPGTPQDETLASYQGFPREMDFRFDTHFSAERAYRFICGTAELGARHEVEAGDAVFAIDRALGYRDDARMSLPYAERGNRIQIRCSAGVLDVEGERLE